RSATRARPSPLGELSEYPVRHLPKPLHALTRGRLSLLQETHHRRHPGTSTNETTQRPEHASPCRHHA
ncbi:hypothetical protein, partial [Streptomyces sp. NPDC059656]|uniref:hypothetical protein n=1 Tax=Streptomyces sp. NPDC059656 TaxID=3346898 RepID=UPI00368ECCAB